LCCIYKPNAYNTLSIFSNFRKERKTKEEESKEKGVERIYPYPYSITKSEEGAATPNSL
jgi:hypothetical protein